MELQIISKQKAPTLPKKQSVKQSVGTKLNILKMQKFHNNEMNSLWKKRSGGAELTLTQAAPGLIPRWVQTHVHADGHYNSVYTGVIGNNALPSDRGMKKDEV